MPSSLVRCFCPCLTVTLDSAYTKYHKFLYSANLHFLSSLTWRLALPVPWFPRWKPDTIPNSPNPCPNLGLIPASCCCPHSQELTCTCSLTSLAWICRSLLTGFPAHSLPSIPTEGWIWSTDGVVPLLPTLKAPYQPQDQVHFPGSSFQAFHDLSPAHLTTPVSHLCIIDLAVAISVSSELYPCYLFYLNKLFTGHMAPSPTLLASAFPCHATPHLKIYVSNVYWCPFCVRLCICSPPDSWCSHTHRS